jgi:hypothetical protein
MSPAIRELIHDALQMYQVWSHPFDGDPETPLVVKYRRTEYVVFAMPLQRYVDQGRSVD